MDDVYTLGGTLFIDGESLATCVSVRNDEVLVSTCRFTSPMSCGLSRDLTLTSDLGRDLT